MEQINKLVSNPKNRDALQIIKSMRNGLVYGGKLRFAHTLVMQFIFKRGVPSSKRLDTVLKMARAHGTILAAYAAIYRVLLLILRKIHGEKPVLEMICGAIAGCFVYGNWNPYFNHAITHQITLFCGARVVLALGKITAFKLAKQWKESKSEKIAMRKSVQRHSWTVFATLTWGSVMYLHRYYPSFLQHGLESSMEFIYDDTDWSDLRSLLGV